MSRKYNAVLCVIIVLFFYCGRYFIQPGEICDKATTRTGPIDLNKNYKNVQVLSPVYEKTSEVNGMVPGRDDFSSLSEVGGLCKDKNSSTLIIHSYMRSGSTFTSDFFRMNSDVFFVYEPLHIGLRTGYLRDIREFNVTEDKKIWVSEIIEKYMSCRLSQLPANVLLNYVAMAKKSPEGNLLKDCIKDIQNPKQENCAEKMDRICASRKLRVTKLVRATTEELGYLLERNKKCIDQIKVIHLLRDPRGRISSLLKFDTPDKLTSVTADTVSHLCGRQIKDIKERKILEKKYPETFLEVHYEDMATKSLQMAQKLYDFSFSLQVPDEVTTWIEKNTKKSASKTVKWKEGLRSKDIDTIQEQCRDLLEYLNLEDL